MHAWLAVREKHHRRWAGGELACCCWDEGGWGLPPFNSAPPCITAGGRGESLPAAAAGRRGADTCFPTTVRRHAPPQVDGWGASLLMLEGGLGPPSPCLPSSADPPSPGLSVFPIHLRSSGGGSPETSRRNSRTISYFTGCPPPPPQSLTRQPGLLLGRLGATQ